MTKIIQSNIQINPFTNAFLYCLFEEEEEEKQDGEVILSKEPDQKVDKVDKVEKVPTPKQKKQINPEKIEKKRNRIIKDKKKFFKKKSHNKK